ncbi:hypothetical protein ZIOFF_043020 [Zingiber officinale]|uniref:Auxin-responsive protein n=1 Tax=Zingiber officinale TaxID=94328 RepID=A0A8J5FWM3_ZINOF|nr:hypothetical protein ZIOFF_043020 [Zingiber officinale]
MASRNIATPFPHTFNGEDYDYWSSRFEVWLKAFDLWNIVDKGFIEPEDEDTLSDAEKKVLVDNRKKGIHALNQINLAIDKGVYEKIRKATTSNQAWEILQKAYKGDEQVKNIQLQILRSEFEKLEMKDNDSVAEYFTKVGSIVNQMASNGEVFDDLRIVQKVFGSVAYSLIPQANRNKFDDEFEKCIFIGYSKRSKAYKLYNPKTNMIVISRDFLFDEDASFDDPKGKANEICIPLYSEQESEEDNSSHSPRNSPSSSTSPPRKMQSVQELLDSTERIEYDDSVLFAFCAGEEPISFDDANKEENAIIKAQAVGWPPVRSFRKVILFVHSEKCVDDSKDDNVNSPAAFVKVSMDGAPSLRKVDLKMYRSYQELSMALQKMFSSVTTSTGNSCSPGMSGRDYMNESKVMDLLNGSEYVPTYKTRMEIGCLSVMFHESVDAAQRRTPLPLLLFDTDSSSAGIRALAVVVARSNAADLPSALAPTPHSQRRRLAPVAISSPPTPSALASSRVP